MISTCIFCISYSDVIEEEVSHDRYVIVVYFSLLFLCICLHVHRTLYMCVFRVLLTLLVSSGTNRLVLHINQSLVTFVSESTEVPNARL